MTSDLQAAAERVRRVDAGENILAVYYPGTHVNGWTAQEGENAIAMLREDRRQLSRAYLALTDPTPIDEAWLREIGADHRLNGEWLVADPRTLGECVEVWCIFTEDGEPPGVIVKPSDHEDCPCIIANCTRGQLNSLLHAIRGE